MVKICINVMGIFRRLTTQSVEASAFTITITTTLANTTFTLPIADYSGLTPNFNVNWGDGSSGTILSSSSASKIHTYVSAGSYTITIAGFMPSFRVNNTTAIKGLITGIVNWGTVGLRQVDFYGCTKITSIPSPDKTTSLSDVENFTRFMSNTGITSIPSGIFDNSLAVINFTDVFSFTNITTIPSGLFTNNTLVTTFNSSFNNCLLLSSYPSNLFDTNINAVNFSSTFRLCKSLTFPQQFTYNTNVTTFGNVYYMSSTSNAMSGVAPSIWTRSPIPYGVGAFHNCTGLSNYGSIPANFI